MSIDPKAKQFIEKTLDKVDIDRQQKIILNQHTEITEQQNKILDIIDHAANSDKAWIIGEMYWGK